MSSLSPVLLFAVAVTLHNLEEAIWLPGWTRVHVKVRFGSIPMAYWIGASIVSVLVWTAAVGAALSSTKAPFHLALSGFALAMSLNALVPHLALSLIKGSYMPGAATGMLLNLPVGVVVIGQQRQMIAASVTAFRTGSALYAALLAVAAFGTLFALTAFFKRPAARRAGKLVI